MLRKKIKTLALAGLLLLIPFAQGCQRDDICPAATVVTPMLNIAFFDLEETDVPKPPVNLRVKAADYDSIFVNRYNSDVISIPLRPNVDITEYEFTIHAPVIPASGEEEPNENTNMDRLTFTYNSEEIYVDRACSYKVNYLGLQVNLENDPNPWINNIIIQEENIENETDVHLHIFH